jgi:protein-L-isoaspartate(D-aspartate) O-methyltransferase
MHAWALQHILDGLFPDATQSTLGHGTLTANDRALQSMSLLDVGSGSGFLTAVFGQLFGTVIGIELHPELVELSKRSLAHIQFPPHGTESTGVRIVQGDGKVGYPACAPYDAIHVGAATEDIPAVLIQQLRVGGVMVLPIAPRGHLHSYGRQEWTRLRKVDAHGTCTRQVLLGVHYVPLV